MSREELGDAPGDRLPPAPPAVTLVTNDGPPATPASTSALPGAPRPGPGRPRISRRLAGLGVAAALVTGLVTGRAGTFWWDSTPTAGDDSLVQDLTNPVLTATVVVADPAGGTLMDPLLHLRVRVTSQARTPVTLTGAGTAYTAARIVSVSPGTVTVTAGGSADLLLTVVVSCRSPLPLRLATLQARARGGRETVPLPVSEAGTALAQACQTAGGGPPVLQFVRTSPDGARLRLVVRSPSGRTALVTGISAGSVRFSGEPRPATVESTERTIWLDPPAVCPAEWVRTGLPRTLRLDIDPGTPGTLTLDAGYGVAAWLRTGPCAGAPGPAS